MGLNDVFYFNCPMSSYLEVLLVLIVISCDLNMEGKWHGMSIKLGLGRDVIVECLIQK